jgi:hypothetical protein
MGMPYAWVLPIPNDAAVPPAVLQATLANGAAVHLCACEALGYDIELDAAATWTGNLEASVDGAVWTVIAAIATAQGALGEHYHYARVAVTGAGDYGDDTLVRIFGKDR